MRREGEEEYDLVGDIRTGIADVSAHLPHDTNMFIAVQQRQFFLLATNSTGVGCSVRLEAGIG